MREKSLSLKDTVNFSVYITSVVAGEFSMSWSSGGMALTEETDVHNILSFVSPMWAGLGSSLGLHLERPMTNCLNCGMADKRCTQN